MTVTATSTSSTSSSATNSSTSSSSSSSSTIKNDSLVWFLEPPTRLGVLTEEGLDHIVHHKYQAGQYTALDLWLNPTWESLTQQLPLWLAPNAVTALGGIVCWLSYGVTAFFASDLSDTTNIPHGVLILNGLCLVVYYTLDCMDGKQARRTKSSSPMGQLFDHGVDCVVNLSHLSLMQAVVGWSSYHYAWLQATMQFGFYLAQLEEYYTGSLPHAAGNFGTTEVLYGLGAWSMLTGMAGIVGWDRTPFYNSSLDNTMVATTLWKIPGMSHVLTADQEDIKVKDLMIVIWVYGFGVLAILSWIRLWNKITETTKCPKTAWRRGVSAASKVVSPLILCALLLLSSTANNIRYPSLAIGLCFCIITIKLVVLGMARMAYASFQWADVCPMILLWIWAHYNSMAYPLATVGFLVRLVWWTRSAVDPLCRQMQVRLFRIPYPPPDHDNDATTAKKAI